MAFTKTAPKTPASVGRLTIHAARLADGSVTATVDFDVLDASGEKIATQVHDLWEHLTATQRTTLTNFLNALHTKATAEAV